MRRLFWLSVGAGAGVYVSHRVKRRVVRFARSWSPEGVAARAVTTGQGAGSRLRHFAADVRTEMRAREEELREAVRLDQAPPDAAVPGRRGARPRVLRARYTIIDHSNDIDDKDGH
ncbi:hypothetical protein BZB76_6788 [Actinomadura pelletieri DSM 43383]|uniref:Secreted protein n=1 Tax=Actinomadura pelletieri DSM 43383 TaxID=1120940 RepID=A0A495Q9R5_9ACTN|nr:hypothetical protein [Actinomadura pelletieri]RKS67836.1 hypothetical protein BZB76_6788 [Actinomadura pelletieri DSM 43383]